MILNILIFAFLFCIVSQSESDEALRLADSLFNLRSYDEAITEYKRFIFFNPEDKRKSYAFYKMGLVYRAERHWAEAVDALGTSIRLTDNDKLKDERTIELGITLIASGNISQAQLELLKVSRFSQHQSIKKKASYFQGVAYLYMFNWESARQAFKNFYSNSERQRHSEEAKRIDSLIVEAQHLPYKSVTIAKILSIILPGAGQIYAGNWKNGLNAMALNSLTIAFFVNATIRKHYQDATILFPVLERYYLGNIYRAGENVKHYNHNLKRKHAAKILQILLED